MRRCVRITLLQLHLATDWAVRGSNPGRGEIIRTRPELPWGSPALKNEKCYTSTTPLGLHGSKVRFTFTFTIYVFRFKSSGLLRCAVRQLPTFRSMAVHLPLFDPAAHEANMTFQDGWNYLTP